MKDNFYIHFALGTYFAEKAVHRLLSITGTEPKKVEEFLAANPLETLFDLKSKSNLNGQVLRISLLPSETFREFLNQFSN